MQRHFLKLRAGIVAGLLTLLALSCLAPAAASAPVLSVTFKTATEYVQPGEFLALYVILENRSQHPLFDIQIVPMAGRLFTIEQMSAKAPVTRLTPDAATITGYRVRPAPDLRPGKYSVLFDVSYQWSDEQERKRGPTRVVKDISLEVRSPAGIGISPPSVNFSARASRDTLREGESLPLYVFIENKSPIPLEGVTIELLETLSVTPGNCKESRPASNAVIPAFGTMTECRTVALDPKASKGLRYGKHTLFFDIKYQWRHGDARFTSHIMAPVDIATSFFGGDAFTQIFGVPLNLIVFVLPGFCFLLVYRATSKRLLQEGEDFTPTTKDGLFYSVLWSVIIIFVYKVLSGKDLYAFFTSFDLFAVNVGAALAALPVPLIRWVKRRREEKARQALKFLETDDVLTVLRKALSRQPDPDQYQEGSVTEGNRVWRGIVLSLPGEPLVLGSQLSISSQDGGILKRIEASKPRAPKEVAGFLKAFSEHMASNRVTIQQGKCVRVKDSKNEPEREHNGLIKVLDSTLQLTPLGSIYLLDVE